ncbi:uncharacterized protein LOC108588353 [Callithrix jacchus]|uniref:uncharacterized protein LOC108588353 n=1 Tax=Callithrix jacchus TaxID=9483 RepID=UPI0023DD64D1|nr:uncharacterized protein LOC108588353 [Callithrix jacchus]
MSSLFLNKSLEGLREGRGPGNWETSSAHKEAARRRTNASPQGKVASKASLKLCFLRVSDSTGRVAPQLSSEMLLGKPAGRRWGRAVQPVSAPGTVGTGNMELMGTSWFGGCCEGAGRARAHTRARTHGHARTHTAQTYAHRGRESPRRACQGSRCCSPPLTAALADWGGGREAVTRATSAAVAFPECRGSSFAGRDELSAAGFAATGCGVCAATLSLGRLAGGGGPRELYITACSWSDCQSK